MKKILLIEDNLDLRENTAELLQLAHYHVTTANNGKEGLERALELKPDLIICDVNMPRMDGLTMCAKVREISEFANTPIFMLTTESNDELKERGKKAFLLNVIFE